MSDSTRVLDDGGLVDRVQAPDGEGREILDAATRLFSERGVPAVIYGAGPRTVLESNAKRADEHIVREDLRRATKVVARTLADLLVR